MRIKGFLLVQKGESNFSPIIKVPIWIVDNIPSNIFPISYEYRNVRGYKGLIFSTRKSEVELLKN